MRKLFRAIRRNEAETVERLVRGKPELVNCVARQPPKKDDGQSPLQVALKTGTMDIAEYLMDMGPTSTSSRTPLPAATRGGPRSSMTQSTAPS